MNGPPDFLVLGAQKAGTTALYHFLGQHPEVFLPRLKEPHFFTYEGTEAGRTGPGRDSVIVREREAYLALFDAARPGQVRGEASPSYLYSAAAAEGILRHAPQVRLVAILRQPVDRAYSNYLHAVRTGREEAATFEEALAREPGRIRDGWGPLWHYLAKGRYDEQVARYRGLFGEEPLLVVLHEDLLHDPLCTVRRVYRHLGVDDAFEPRTETTHNASRVPTNAAARLVARAYAVLPGGLRERLLPHRLRHAVRDRVLATPPRLDPALRDALTRDEFDDSIRRLEGLLDRDLSSWLRPTAVEEPVRG